MQISHKLAALKNKLFSVFKKVCLAFLLSRSSSVISQGSLDEKKVPDMHILHLFSFKYLQNWF